MARPEAPQAVRHVDTGLRPGQADGGVPGLHPAAKELVKREIPHAFIDAQLARYTPEATQIRSVRRFDPFAVSDRLIGMAGNNFAIAVDAGGKKEAIEVVGIKPDGRLESIGRMQPFRSVQGEGYMEKIDAVARQTDGGRDFAVGFSVAGPTDGTKPEVLTNLSKMQDDLAEPPYNGDLANAFPNATSVDGDNDAITGAVAAAIEATRENANIKKVLFIINGGGLGGAVWADGEMMAAEPGHIAAISELNPFGRDTLCGQETSPAKDQVCVERLAGSGAGVEALHYMVTGKTKIVDGQPVPLEGEEIEQLYLDGDETATKIIDYAAIITATAILGLDQATRPEDQKDGTFDASSTAIVGHGGFFRYQGVRERVARIIKERTGSEPTMLFADDFTKETTGNACADGAAILAFTATQRDVEPAA